MDDPELLIPLVAIVMSLGIPIAWFFFDSRNKRARYQAVEKLAHTVQDPALIERLLKDDRESRIRRRRPYVRGFVITAVGAALIVSRPQYGDGPEPWVATVLLFVGIALILADFMSYGFRRQSNSDDQSRPGGGAGNIS